MRRKFVYIRDLTSEDGVNGLTRVNLSFGKHEFEDWDGQIRLKTGWMIMTYFPGCLVDFTTAVHSSAQSCYEDFCNCFDDLDLPDSVKTFFTE